MFPKKSFCATRVPLVGYFMDEIQLKLLPTTWRNWGEGPSWNSATKTKEKGMYRWFRYCLISDTMRFWLVAIQHESVGPLRSRRSQHSEAQVPGSHLRRSCRHGRGNGHNMQSSSRGAETQIAGLIPLSNGVGGISRYSYCYMGIANSMQSTISLELIEASTHTQQILQSRIPANSGSSRVKSRSIWNAPSVSFKGSAWFASYSSSSSVFSFQPRSHLCRRPPYQR
jgi:hypothetical protein